MASFPKHTRKHLSSSSFSDVRSKKSRDASFFETKKSSMTIAQHQSEMRESESNLKILRAHFGTDIPKFGLGEDTRHKHDEFEINKDEMTKHCFNWKRDYTIDVINTSVLSRPGAGVIPTEHASAALSYVTFFSSELSEIFEKSFAKEKGGSIALIDAMKGKIGRTFHFLGTSHGIETFILPDPKFSELHFFAYKCLFTELRRLKVYFVFVNDDTFLDYFFCWVDDPNAY